MSIVIDRFVAPEPQLEDFQMEVGKPELRPDRFETYLGQKNVKENLKVYVEAAAQSKGWNTSAISATYQYYVPGTSALAADAGTWAAGGCPGGVRTPRLIQLVTISLRSESGTINRSIQVVKSDV